jgi:hypothetical protein
MQFLLPHEASTTCSAGTEPGASVQLRRRRPYAVDGLAINSQSPFRVVGENSPIANQECSDSLAGDCNNTGALKRRFGAIRLARRGSGRLGRFRGAGSLCDHPQRLGRKAGVFVSCGVTLSTAANRETRRGRSRDSKSAWFRPIPRS